MKTRVLSLLLVLCLMLAVVTPVASAASNTFTDIPYGAWYAKEVKWAFKEGLMNGTGNDTFTPNGTTTRGMIVTVLWRLESEPYIVGGSDFSDVAADTWYTEAVRWASYEGIVDGYGNGLFGPNDPITREQLATILFRYAKYQGENMLARADLTCYNDANAISDYAYEALSWAKAKDLINGITDTTLNPQGYATRAQVAVILYRMDSSIGSLVALNDLLHKHDYADYEYNGNGTHTGRCDCGKKDTDDCEVSYKINDDGTHTLVCDICDREEAPVACPGFTSDEATHSRVCDVCGRDETTAHQYVNGKCECGAELTEGSTADPVAVIGSKGYDSLEDAIAAVQSGETIILRKDALLEDVQLKVSGKDFTILGANEDVCFDGQLMISSGTVKIKDLTVLKSTMTNTSTSQYQYSSIGLMNTGCVECENVTFAPTLNQSTCITAWWSTGSGANITVTDCTFNCNGQRPIRSDACVTVEGCTFNDPHRYAVQMTSKSSTMDADAPAFVTFNDNTINAGTTSSEPVYGVQLEGGYGCSDLTVNGEGNTIELGDTGKDATMYYCECGKVDHATITWNTEVDAVHQAPQDLLEDMMTAAGSATEISLSLPAGSYTLPATAGKTVSIEGSEETVVNVNSAFNAGGSDIAFEGVTVKGANKNYTGLQHCGDITFTDCVIENAFFLYGDSAVFTNCEINLNSMYLWTYGAKEVTFNNCTFNTDGKALLVYIETATLDQIININGCTFKATAAAYTSSGDHCAAIEIDASLINGTMTVNFTGENYCSDNFSALYRIKNQKNPSNVIINQ